MSKTPSRATTSQSVDSAAAVLEEPDETGEPAAIPTALPKAQAKVRSYPDPRAGSATSEAAPKKARATSAIASTKRFTAVHSDDGGNRQAELFYLQKQIQLQTQMIFILEDGSRIQGIVEWYDRQSIKVRGKSRVLIYKSAIKYLYKAGEIGVAPTK